VGSCIDFLHNLLVCFVLNAACRDICSCCSRDDFLIVTLLIISVAECFMMWLIVTCCMFAAVEVSSLSDGE